MSRAPGAAMLHEETGEVVRVGPSRAWVKVLATSACGSCRSACGMSEEGYRLVEVIDPIGVRPRQEVGLQLPGGALVSAALLMYGLPVALLLLGLGVGHFAALRLGLPADWVGAGAAFTFMGAGFVGLYRARHYFEDRQSFYPTITRITASAAEPRLTPPAAPFSL